MNSRLLVFYVFGATAILGCGSSSAGGGYDSIPPTWSEGSDSSNNNGGIGIGAPQTDAGAQSDGSNVVAPSAAPPDYQGSPLCNASLPKGCYPDELPNAATTAASCGEGPDGGVYDPEAGYAAQPLACHVIVDDAGIRPACLPAGQNQPGAPCSKATDCAPGSECVDNPGVCRHYCCSGDSLCQADQFCDIRALTQDQAMKVPVCVPTLPCGLLGAMPEAGTCSQSETCVVGRLENGVTSCVPIGGALAGQSCMVEHCGRNLQCLAGVCYALCHTTAPLECAPGQTCTGGLPVFTNPGVGVCQPGLDATR